MEVLNKRGDCITIDTVSPIYEVKKGADWLYFQTTPTSVKVYANVNDTTSTREDTLTIQYSDEDYVDYVIQQPSLYEASVFNITADSTSITNTGGVVTFTVESAAMKTPYIVNYEGVWTSDYSQYQITFPESQSNRQHHVIFVGHTVDNQDLIREVLINQTAPVKIYTYYTYTGDSKVTSTTQMTPHQVTSRTITVQLNGDDKKCVAVAGGTVQHFEDSFTDYVDDLVSNSNGFYNINGVSGLYDVGNVDNSYNITIELNE